MDLKQEKGKQLFYELVKKFDVVLDNFSSESERLGIDFPTLKKYNPKIITCSISGLGKVRQIDLLMIKSFRLMAAGCLLRRGRKSSSSSWYSHRRFIIGHVQYYWNP